jgi:hypothetical protein
MEKLDFSIPLSQAKRGHEKVSINKHGKFVNEKF